MAVISFHRGGMANYAAMMVRSLRSAGPATEVACFVCADFPAGLLADDIPVYRYPVPHSLAPGDGLRWLAAARITRQCLRDLTEWNTDIAHFNSGHLWYIPLISRLRRRIPLVYTLHDADIHPGEWHVYEELKRRPLLRHASRIVLHSEHLRELAIARYRIPRERTAVIPCGVLRLPVSFKTGEELRPHDLLVPGRILAYKGYEVLLEALPDIVVAVPRVRVIIAGEGDFTPWQSRAAQWGERIQLINRFLPESELTRLIATCGMVVLPYREASQSGVALLVASLGKPIVASRVGAIPDVIEDGVTGRLVEPGNPRKLAAAIVDLLRKPHQARAMGITVRELNEVAMALE